MDCRCCRAYKDYKKMIEKCSHCSRRSQLDPLSKTRLSELISMRFLRKNPSGALIWGIFGGSLIMYGYFWVHFLRRKEYQINHKERMWNERFEMLENPVPMKLYYPCDEVPQPSQPLIDVYKKMKDEEEDRRCRIEECIRAINVKKQ